MGILYLIVLILTILYIYESYQNMKMRKDIKHLHNTLDHYGMRMSNKMVETNPFYKRWFKKDQSV